jgi:hypothetical protein
MMRRCCVRVRTQTRTQHVRVLPLRSGRSGDRLLVTLRIVWKIEMLAKSSTLQILRFSSP